MALSRSGRFASGLKGRFSTAGCWRSRHRSALVPARRVQWMRDCCPAPTPITCPSTAKHTELDWVYLSVIQATIISRTALSGSSRRLVTMFLKSSRVTGRSLRRCSKVMPYTSRVSNKPRLVSRIDGQHHVFCAFLAAQDIQRFRRVVRGDHAIRDFAADQLCRGDIHRIAERHPVAEGRHAVYAGAGVSRGERGKIQVLLRRLGGAQRYRRCPRTKLIGREVSDGVIAPDYASEALDILRSKKGAKYVVLAIDPGYEPGLLETRDVYGITLEQRRGSDRHNLDDFKNIVSSRRDLPESAVGYGRRLDHTRTPNPTRCVSP